MTTTNTTVATETVKPTINTSDPDVVIGGSLVTLAFSIVGGFMWLRRRLSADNLQIKKEEGEKTLLDLVIVERNRAIEDHRKALEEARLAWEARAMDAKQIGSLTAQVESLKQLNHKMNNEVYLLRLHVGQLSREINTLLGRDPNDVPFGPKNNPEEYHHEPNGPAGPV